MTNRYSNIDGTGVAILNLCITKDLGWICRNTNNSDVGIDATVEQVVGGEPTAKYISVQLKTGMGNVYFVKNSDFTYYIDNIHYEYWLSSSVPVIIVLCDIETNILYWQLIKKQNILVTKTQYKIIIPNTHILNKSSLDELNTIIDTYQSDFLLPEVNDEDISDVGYWEELLLSCSQAIAVGTDLFNELDKKYKENNSMMEQFLRLHPGGIDKHTVDKEIRKYARKNKLAIDICKTQFKGIKSIVVKTHIEAIRLCENAFQQVKNAQMQIDYSVSNYLKNALNKELKEIESNIIILNFGANQFMKRTSPDYQLQNSEYSFGLILNEYAAELGDITCWIKKLVNMLEDLLI